MKFEINNRVRCFQSKCRKSLIGQEGLITNIKPGYRPGKFIMEVSMSTNNAKMILCP